MIRSSVSFALLFTAATLATGCYKKKVDFKVSKAVVINSETTSVDKTEEIDVYKEAPDLEEYRDNVEEVKLASMTGTIENIEVDNMATKMTGGMKMSGVSAGDISDFGIVDGNVAQGTLSKELDAAVEKALVSGGGKLPVNVQGTTVGAPAKFTMRVRASGKATVKVWVWDLL